MSDFKSKLPDLKELGSMTSKLFNGIKSSINEIIHDYKEKRAVEPEAEKTTEQPKTTQQPEAEVPSTEQKTVAPEPVASEPITPEPVAPEPVKVTKPPEPTESDSKK